MTKWRVSATVGVWALAGLLGSLQAAETKYALKEKIEVGNQWRIEIDLRLAGQIHYKSGDKTVSLQLSAWAQHQFPERVLNVNGDGLPERTARFYEQARASITVHGSTSARNLRLERRLQIAQQIKGDTVTYAPSGPLTREEHELTGEHLDLLAVPGLLPAKEVAVGETWEVPHPVVQALTGLDGLISQELRCKLEKVEGDYATISISGPVVGISHGSEVTITVDGVCQCDVKAQRWVALQWKQKDERNQGPISPVSKTEGTTTVRRTFPGLAEVLSDSAVANIPEQPNAAHLLLSCRDPKDRWAFLSDRSWHVVAQTEQYSVLRLLDRGELVAQLNVVNLPKSNPGQHLSADEVRKRVTEVPGLTIDQVLQVGEVPAEAGHWIYRVSIAGRSDDINVLQNYYAVAGPQGDQVLLSFTTEVPLADRLGGRDLSLVGTVSFPQSK